MAIVNAVELGRRVISTSISIKEVLPELSVIPVKPRSILFGTTRIVVFGKAEVDFLGNASHKTVLHPLVCHNSWDSRSAFQGLDETRWRYASTDYPPRGGQKRVRLRLVIPVTVEASYCVTKEMIPRVDAKEGASVEVLIK